MARKHTGAKRRPRTTRPPLATKIPGVKASPGWGVNSASGKSYGIKPQQRSTKTPQPAGDPPPDWPGSRDQWAVYWALTGLGYHDGTDFSFKLRLDPYVAKRYGSIDFLVWKDFVAIQTSSPHWQDQSNPHQELTDAWKRALVAGYGMRLIWVNEEDILGQPIYFTREALAGRDHSTGHNV